MSDVTHPKVSREEAIRDLAKRIKGIRFALLTTHGEGGRLLSRPMTTIEAEFDGELWFFTGADTEVAREIQTHPEVNVAYTDNQSLWISVSGKAHVLRDEAKMQELWNPAVKAYFPDGLEDPNLRLIRIDAEWAEYWDAPASKLVQAFNIAKAVITGKRDKQGEHGEVEL
jgi:general stress protein 26